MFDNLRADMARFRGDRKRMIAETAWGKFVWLQNVRVLLSNTIWSVISYRFSHWVYKLRVPVVKQILTGVALLFQKWVELWTSCHICREADIGPGLLIHSPYCIGIGATKIGKNLTVGMGVLITSGAKGLGDNVYFGPGAKLIGDTRIGNNVVVAANSLVISDVPDNATVIGVPARIMPGGEPKRFPTEMPVAISYKS
jgi:serine O-acetyltransferase